LSWRRQDVLGGLAAILIPFVVYCATLCPTVYVGDSGELTTAALTLGIPHPPGYPLYVVTGFLFSQVVPWGSPAWKINLFSAVCAALACGGLFRLLRRVGHPIAVSLSAALVLAFSAAFWSQAVVARVYCLGALFLVLLLDRGAAWYLQRRDRDLLLAAGLWGFGMANHTVILTGLAAVLALVLATEPKTLLRWRLLVLMTAASLPGLSLYALLPLRSRTNPELDWANPETVEKLWAFLSRREYWQRAYVEGFGDAVEVAWFYVRTIPQEFTWLGAGLVLMGALILNHEREHLGFLFMIPLPVNVALMALHGSWSDIFFWRRYMISGYVGLSCALAWALAWIASRSRSRAGKLGICLVPPALCLFVFYSLNDRSQHTIARDYSVSVLRTLPRNSVLIAQDDNVLFPLIYLQIVERWRTDVKLVMQGVAELSTMKIDLERAPVFFTHWNNLKNPEVRLVPEGLVYHLIRSSAPWTPVLPWSRYSFASAEDPDLHQDYLTRNLVAGYYFMEGINYERIDPARAAAAFAKAGRIAFDNDVTQYNLGLAYARDGRPADAYRQFQRVLEINPRYQLARQRLAELETSLGGT
jgi:hypothetical protein